MELLDHLILPVYSLLHTAVIYLVLIRGDIKATIQLFDWPDKDLEGGNNELTVWETHCFGIIVGAHLALLFGCLIGILHEKSHFRAMVTVMELLFWANGAIDAYRHGMPCAFANIMAGLAIFGLALHAKNEAGLATREGDSTSTSKQKSE
mmetsp:Transcript_27150/g.45279  ORF Transcript_27150/g.45279 Transcript_27150/m.45279 type:complete len:150 (+) Transcript_27150:127-576(+)|eukprot:CAMPEP_0119018898 /NCGR_PEP_ID=MMETSP1176-20130426/20541_1 /TAXON_ID=265551 /ORGANISM="Synedropsis recta cf, Strain CCMP1620" /LENGTH=149 /DNA_ID=CAMNT_0006972999 /DNA_START=40 /DNA_END=489 /DNA_ORIENTATION=+